MKIAIMKKRLRNNVGITNCILQEIKIFNDMGYTPYILTESINSTLKKTLLRELKYIPVLFKSLFKQSLENYDKKCKKWIDRNKPDLVISQGDSVSDDIVFVHNCYELMYELLYKRVPDQTVDEKDISNMYRKAFMNPATKVIVANSELSKKDIVKRYNIEPVKVKVVYPELNLNRFSNLNHEEKRKKGRNLLGYDCDVKLTGLVTSGDFEKRNGKFYVEIIENLLKEMPDVKAVLIGKADPSAINEIVKSKGMENNFKVVSVFDDVESIYHALDVAVLPGKLEEFGFVVPEAMACGTPSLVSDFVGAGELYIKNGIDMVLPVSNPKDWADKIRKLLSDNTYRENIISSGIRIARTYTSDNYAVLKSIFEDIIKENLINRRLK